MQRLRLYDCRNSRLPAAVGLCQADIPGIARFVNAAQQRLLYCKEAGNDGWWGTFAEMVFEVNPDDPYITTPREVARIISHTWCDQWVPLENIYYSYLSFGNGRLPKQFVNSCIPFTPQTFARNNVVTFVNIEPPVRIRIYVTEESDVGKRALIQGLDSNDVPIYTQDGTNRVNGIFVSLDSPFVTTTIAWNQITGIQKDVTDGDVRFYQVDSEGDETLILTMEPGEQTASYRRYYLNNLPNSCCPPPSATGTVQVTAIVKLDLIPVVYDTDYLLIGNLEAITEEAQAVRYAEMDRKDSKEMVEYHHRNAVRFLNGELNHFIGQEQPAVNFRPFGSADLRCKQIGTLL